MTILSALHILVTAELIAMAVIAVVTLIRVARIVFR